MPILSIIEAKRDNLEASVDQCAAQLYGVPLINRGLGHPMPVNYGCVTNARDGPTLRWLFLKFEHDQYRIDNTRYQLDRLPEFLGVFHHILDLYTGDSG